MSEMREQRKARILAALNEPACRLMTAADLAVWLDVPALERPEFEAVLAELAETGAVVVNRRGRYGLAERLGMSRGRFSGNARGFGFVALEEGGGPDLYIAAEDTLGAMDGDTVLCKSSGLSLDGRRREGVVVRIVERAHQRIVGRFTETPSGGFVTPDSKKLTGDVRVDAAHAMSARTGQKVVVSLTKWSDGESASEGEIIVVLGAETEPGVDILSVLWANDIPVEFPDDVLQEAERLPEMPGEADFAGRRDLRALPMVTIDGEDARDLDDAVSLEELPDGLMRLGVHIADVSHYVREGSALDCEALARGTSVYLPDRVIPMFPEALSNGLCSLTAQVPRLAFSVTMDVDASGEVVAHDIFESVLFIDERMTYTHVRALLEDDVPELAARYASLLPMFRRMRELAARLGERRRSRGSIDFSFDESKVVCDGEGHPVEIERRTPNVATNLIEEFMLLCNETVCEHFTQLKVPFVYRIHEDPDPEEMINLRQFLGMFGYSLPNAQSVHPADLQAVLRKIKDTPEEKAISTVILRSLQKARYSHEHIWHFGLAAPYYSHFTSPIRRYPDLQIHRIMKETLTGSMDEKRKAHYAGLLPEATKHMSERERAADDAERECTDMKKAEYMQKHVGEVFDGVVSGVASFGFFVELPNTVEGLVRLSSLEDDYYEYDERTMTLHGSRSGREIRIGDPIRVLVAKASPEMRQIDFVPEGASETLIERFAENAESGKTSGSFRRMDGRYATDAGGRPGGRTGGGDGVGRGAGTHGGGRFRGTGGDRGAGRDSGAAGRKAGKGSGKGPGKGSGKGPGKGPGKGKGGAKGGRRGKGRST